MPPHAPSVSGPWRRGLPPSRRALCAHRAHDGARRALPPRRSDTDTYQKGIYAWQPSALDETLSDDALLRALAARLKYVHTTAAQCLAQVVKEPNVAKNPNAFGEHGVDAPVLRAFAASLLYNLSLGRCERLLANKRGGKAPPPILSVPKFLALFANGGPSGGGAKAPPLSERYKGRSVEKLSAREQKLLLTMRDYLFEQVPAAVARPPRHRAPASLAPPRHPPWPRRASERFVLSLIHI